jgi:hypothetical protein
MPPSCDGSALWVSLVQITRRFAGLRLNANWLQDAELRKQRKSSAPEAAGERCHKARLDPGGFCPGGFAKPSGKAKARMVSSVIVVGTLDDFFGQEIQSAASALSNPRNSPRIRSRSSRRLTKTWAISTRASGSLTNTTEAGSGASKSR